MKTCQNPPVSKNIIPDSKRSLSNYCTSKKLSNPTYCTTGDDHNHQCTVTLSDGTTYSSNGSWPTALEAEQSAARTAIRYIYRHSPRISQWGRAPTNLIGPSGFSLVGPDLLRLIFSHSPDDIQSFRLTESKWNAAINQEFYWKVLFNILLDNTPTANNPTNLPFKKLVLEMVCPPTRIFHTTTTAYRSRVGHHDNWFVFHQGHAYRFDWINWKKLDSFYTWNAFLSHSSFIHFRMAPNWKQDQIYAEVENRCYYWRSYTRKNGYSVKFFNQRTDSPFVPTTNTMEPLTNFLNEANGNARLWNTVKEYLNNKDTL